MVIMISQTVTVGTSHQSGVLGQRRAKALDGTINSIGETQPYFKTQTLSIKNIHSPLLVSVVGVTPDAEEDDESGDNAMA